MLGWKNPDRVSVDGGTPTRWFDRLSGTWRAVFEAKPLPSPGAMNYAYESLGLAMFAPAGRGVFAPGTPNPLPHAPLYQQGTASVQGIPVVAGQIFRQPLVTTGSK